MSKRSEAVRKWRENTKKRMVESMGGQCANCGYNKCHDALEFHHLDQTQKDFGISKIRASPSAWAKIVAELRKCVILCSNCHREVHGGIIHLPADPPRFDEKYVDYKKLTEKHPFSICPICGSKKPISNLTCSLACGAKKRSKVDWSLYDLPAMKEKHTNVEIAEIVGVSDMAVRKRLKKLTAIGA